MRNLMEWKHDKFFEANNLKASAYGRLGPQRHLRTAVQERHRSRANPTGTKSHLTSVHSKTNRLARSAESSTLLIKNLHPSTSQDDVNVVFSRFGPITDIKHSPSRSLVTFENRKDATVALTEYHNQNVDGRIISITYERPSGDSFVGAASKGNVNDGQSVQFVSERFKPKGMYADRVDEVTSSFRNSSDNSKSNSGGPVVKFVPEPSGNIRTSRQRSVVQKKSGGIGARLGDKIVPISQRLGEKKADIKSRLGKKK